MFVLACTDQRLTHAHLLLSWLSLTQGFTGDISCRDFYSCAHDAENKQCSNHHSQEQSSTNLPTLHCSSIGRAKECEGTFICSLHGAAEGVAYGAVEGGAYGAVEGVAYGATGGVA